jgi:hypothetical protein
LGREDIELGRLFGISRVTAGRVFSTWMNFLYYQFMELYLFLPKEILPKEIVQEYRPEDFKLVIVRSLRIQCCWTDDLREATASWQIAAFWYKIFLPVRM